jgi:esterase/lipase
MREIGRRFQEHGFLVRSILLPGHGTVPADLQYVTMEDWLNTVKFGFDSLAREVDNIWAAGFSGGASLALHHALKDVDITAMVTISPSLQLCNPYARYARLLRLLSHYANIPIWLDALDNDDYTKYGTYPVNLAAQAHRLAHTVHHLLETQTYDHPLWMTLSADDETTDSHLAKKVFLQQPNAANRLLWYCAEPQLSIEPRVIHRNSAFPDEHVLDFSHTSMQISPENPHYGRMGDYVPPLYTPKNDIEDRTIYRGALTKKNLAKHVMRRLTYNPDYVFMMSQLDAFIKQASTLCH